MLKFGQKLVVDLPKNLIHYSGCPELKSIKAGRIKPVHHTLKDIYVYCPVCQTISYIFKANEQTNIDVLNELGIQYLLTDKSLYLQTEKSFWKIKYEYPIDKQRLILCHGNFAPTSTKIRKYKSHCYHRQNDALGYRNIPQILNYIVEHDKFRDDPSSAVSKQMPKGGKRQKSMRKHHKNSVQKARIRRTLDLLDNIKNNNDVNNR